MWVYTGDDIEPRLSLNAGEAFWLDYWLTIIFIVVVFITNWVVV